MHFNPPSACWFFLYSRAGFREGLCCNPDLSSQVHLCRIHLSPAICTSCSVRLWSTGRCIRGKQLLLWHTTVSQTHKSISSLFVVLFQKPVHQVELRWHELSEGEVAHFNPKKKQNKKTKKLYFNYILFCMKKRKRHALHCNIFMIITHHIRFIQ